jgi:MFS family permease
VALVGFGFSLTFPILTGALQEALPDRMRGRIMAVHQMAHLGNRPFTALAAGSLASIFATPVALAAAVALAPVGLLATGRARLPVGAPPAAVRRDDQIGEALPTAPE